MMSQLDLAVEAEVSARHLSFVETGRSKPSRELLAAGYAPAYHQTSLDDQAMEPVRGALDKILAGHEPFPAVIIDRRWDLVLANAPAFLFLTDGIAPELLAPPVNTLRVSLHPEGLAPRIANLSEYSAHLTSRLLRQATV